MRCETTRIRRGHIKHEVVGRRLTAIGNDNRRLFITCAEHKAERLEFSNFSRLNDVSNFLSRSVTDGAGLFEPGTDELVANCGIVDHRFSYGSLVNLSALFLVRRKQVMPAPTLNRGGEFPTDIDRVPDAHVHAEPTKWRMQVTCVSC